MKSDRNNYMPQMMSFPANVPTNMMMFPNFMNDSCSNLENRVSNLEKKVKIMESRLSRLEAPYSNNNNNNNLPNQNQIQQMPYQSTQNNANYNGEMYMM